MKIFSRFWKRTFSLEIHLLLLYRLSRHVYLNWGAVGRFLAYALRHIMRVYTSCDISPLAQIDKGVKFPHPLCIVIGDGVKIGKGTMIWQQVTLGSHGRFGIEADYPVIGTNVRIYANASILGAVSIGNDAVIGAHAVVTKNVPSGMVAYGIPAIVERKKGVNEDA